MVKNHLGLLHVRTPVSEEQKVIGAFSITKSYPSVQFSSSVVSESATSCNAAGQVCLSINNSTHVYSDSCPLSRWCHPSISSSVIPFSSCLQFSQHQGLLKWISSSHQRAKVLDFQLHISLSNEYLGLISFRMEWLDLLEVQEILKSLLQQHSSKASILRHSAFFIVQLLYPYVTTRKTIAWTR